MTTALLIVSVGAGLVPTVAAPAVKLPTPTAAQAEFFERRVRPVLLERCVSCHGPGRQQSGLRLDTRAALEKGGESGPLFNPASPDQGALLRAIRHEGRFKMPPTGKLPAAELEVLERWVTEGAYWPAAASRKVPSPQSPVPRSGTNPQSAIRNPQSNHWAFKPVRRPALPSVKMRSWVRTPIDAFVLAKLEAKGLKPSPVADRRTLIRRASFDLIGLPPTPEEIAAFENDRAPGAWERVVDRLLASPHYGERCGRYWLDVARYSDTKGYVFFEEPRFPWAWTYRDYVIRAFNEDLPYNRFIVEQLAADQLDLGADKRPLTAMGFLTLGGRFMNNPHDIVDDRIDVVTRGLLGLTVSCARCHDHKFDPVPTKDYYSLYGVFASSQEPAIPPLFEPPPATEAYAKFETELKAREAKLTEFVRAKHTEVVQSARTRVAEYMLAAHAVRNQPDTEDFMLLADGGDLNPKMAHRWKAYLERSGPNASPVFSIWRALQELPEKEFAARAPAAIAGLKTANPLIARAFRERPPTSIADAAARYAEVMNRVDRLWQAVQLAGESAKFVLDPAADDIRRVFYGPDAPPDVQMSPTGDLALLPDRPAQAKLQELLKVVEQWRADGPGAPPRAMVLEDRETLYEPRVFRRGSPANAGDPVPRQFLQLLSGPNRKPFAQGAGRLELANAIADSKNPLTARVMVNRVWLGHFGAGLVRTPSDFGVRSEAPTHPELLDWLAAAFSAGASDAGIRRVESPSPPGFESSNPLPAHGLGWSIKKLHRLILVSSAYMQRSDERSDGTRVDPENRLLWRMNRRRLDWEATRDALLATSGSLDAKIGGPAVDAMSASLPARRTVYASIDRLNLPGLLRTFDFPSPDATSPQRDQTTVPQQALYWMNHPFVRACARRLVERKEVAGAADPAARVEALYKLLYGRAPEAEERSAVLAFLGATPSPAQWERCVQALLQANEFVFID